MALARAPRTTGRNVNLSVGFLMLLLIASLLLYRLGIQSTVSCGDDLPRPAELWQVPLLEANGAASVGRYSFVLTKDKLGSSALMVVNDQGLLVRTESLGSTGRFAIASSPLGVICSGIDQGTVSLYGADGKRRWTAHTPGPVTMVVGDQTGITAAFGPQPGAKAGDGVLTILADGTTSRPVAFPYGAVTTIARGPEHSVAVSVFTADPSKAAEALVFVQPDGTALPVAGAGLGAARLTSAGESYFAGTARAISAYDSCGQRRWTARATGTRLIAAQAGIVAAASADTLSGFDAESGRRLWRRNLGAAPDAMVGDADGIVVATSEGLIAFDWQGRTRWLLPDAGLGWDLGDGVLIVIQREMAIAYRTR